MKEVPDSFFGYNNRVYNEKVYRIYKWMVGETAPPYKIILVPTNRCNLKCFCCPNAYARSLGKLSRFKEEKEISDEQWLSVVKEGLEMDVKEWYILGGGEPMMRKKLVLKIVEIIKKKDSSNICEIITNGTLWDKKDVKKVTKLRLDRLLISIDSDNELHDYLRGREGVFRDATKTLVYFQKYKSRFKSDKPFIQMNSVINNQNYNKIKDLVDYASKLGVERLAIHPMREYEETKKIMAHLKLVKYQILELNSQLSFLEAYARSVGLNLNLDMVRETIPGPKIRKEVTKGSSNVKKMRDEKSEPYMITRCFEPFYSIFIDPRGNANFCCTAGDSKTLRDNVITKSLEDLWYSRFFNKVRKIIISNGKVEKCDICGLSDMTNELRNDIKKYVEHIK